MLLLNIAFLTWCFTKELGNAFFRALVHVAIWCLTQNCNTLRVSGVHERNDVIQGALFILISHVASGDFSLSRGIQSAQILCILFVVCIYG